MPINHALALQSMGIATLCPSYDTGSTARERAAPGAHHAKLATMGRHVIGAPAAPRGGGAAFRR